MKTHFITGVNVPTLDQVFGVSASTVLSYVERNSVDSSFTAAMAADKQIVVYGASKQGKTALVQRHLPYESNIIVRLTPKTEIADAYRSILRQAGITIQEGHSTERSGEASIKGKAGFKALIPIFGGAEASTEIGAKGGTVASKDFTEVPFNLELPQDISELLAQAKISKTIILENFHYLSDKKQRQFAFDLRTFQELGIRFVILGVWKERNRLAQFNGDLLDRIHEVPVEPWLDKDFDRVVEKGEHELNISFDTGLKASIKAASFSSIGVYQELLKQTCALSGITKTAESLTPVDPQRFAEAKSNKAEDYSTRHERALEAIATGNISGGGRGDAVPLFLPYYLVRVLCGEGFAGLATGMRRPTIQERIQAIHHRPDDVRASDMSNLLHNLGALQASKNISPPIVDYNQGLKLLQVVDSTFYFFLRNGDLPSFLDGLSNPVDDYKAKLAANVQQVLSAGDDGGITME